MGVQRNSSEKCALVRRPAIKVVAASQRRVDHEREPQSLLAELTRLTMAPPSRAQTLMLFVGDAGPRSPQLCPV